MTLGKKNKDSTKEKSIDGRKSSIGKKGSANGKTPFARWGISIVVATAISLIASIGSYNNLFIHYPESFVDLQDILLWIVSSMAVPYIISFLLTSFLSLYIITQSSASYCLWVMKQGAGTLLMWMTVSIVFSFVFIGAIFDVLKPDDFFVTSRTLDDMTYNVWLASLEAAMIVPWISYRTTWKIYRVVGARTMQQRYEDDIANMEIDNTGKWWDRFVTRSVKSITGIDGHKPRGFIITILPLFILSIFSAVLGHDFGITAFIPITIIGFPVSAIALNAAISKYRDGKHNRKRPPFLIPVRGPSTVDKYNPASKGVRQFVSK